MRSLAEEGVLIRNFRLIEHGAGQPAEWAALEGTAALRRRLSLAQAATNLADSAAQVAANQQGARDLLALAERQSLDYVLAYMSHIQLAAERKTRRALAALADGVYPFAGSA